MSLSINRSKLLIVLAFASIYIIWGTTFLSVAYGLKGFPPFILSGLRFLIAGLIITAWLYRKGERPFNVESWKRNTIPGVLILAAGVGLVAWGEQYMSATEAAIVMATEPFGFILLDKKNRNYYLSNKVISIGLVIGFLGLVLFLKDSLLATSLAPGTGRMRFLAFGVLLISSVLWVLGALYARRKPSGDSVFMNVGQQLVIGGVASLLIASFRGEWRELHLAGIPASAWAGLIYLIIFGSVVAYLSFIWLLSVKSPALVSTHTYVNPVVAVVTGWLVAGDMISRTQFVALFIILAGVGLTNMMQYNLPKRKLVRLRNWNKQIGRIASPYKHITQY